MTDRDTTFDDMPIEMDGPGHPSEVLHVDLPAGASIAEGAEAVRTGSGGVRVLDAEVPLRRPNTNRVMSILPRTYGEVCRLAELYHQSGLAPQGMNSPQKVAIAMLTGMDIGLKPMAAVNGIAVINNRPCIFGDTAMAVIRGTGLLEDFHEFFEGEPYEDDFTAHCMIRRVGEKRDHVSTFSVEDARVAYLWDERETIIGRNRESMPNPAPWFRFKKRMLLSRARGFRTRDSFQDVLKGMALAEEMQDVADRMEKDEAPPAATPVRGYEVRSLPSTEGDPAKLKEMRTETVVDYRDEAPSPGEAEGSPEKAAEGDRLDPEQEDSRRKLEAALASIKGLKTDEQVRALFVKTQGLLLNADMTIFRTKLEARKKEIAANGLAADKIAAWLRQSKDAIDQQKAVAGIRHVYSQAFDDVPSGPDREKAIEELREYALAAEERIAKPDADQPDATRAISKEEIAVAMADGDNWEPVVNGFRAALLKTETRTAALDLWEAYDNDLPSKVRDRMEAMFDTHTHKLPKEDVADHQATDDEAPPASAPAREATFREKEPRVEDVMKAMRTSCKSTDDLQTYFDKTWKPISSSPAYNDADRQDVLDCYTKRKKLFENKGV